MALTFPNNPAGQTPANTFSPTSSPAATSNGVTYTWNGTAWVTASGGGGGGGTVTAVTGTAPIVSSGGTAPAISITAASDTAAGAIEIATLAEAATGTDATRASSPSTAVPKTSADMAGAAILPSGTAATAPAGSNGYARVATDLGQLTFYAGGAYFPIGFGPGGSTTNTAAGLAALDSNTTGTFNTAFGQNALTANTTGTSNTATGVNALTANTTGTNNTATGVNALISNTFGSGNVALGQNALLSNTTACSNTAVGTNSMRCNLTGDNNVAVGLCALFANTTGANNTATGTCALASNTLGENNTAIGLCALASNTTACGNSALGIQAGYFNQTGNQGTYVGYQAGFNTTGSQNTLVGACAGLNLTTGNGNTIVGAGISGSAGMSNTLKIGAGGTSLIDGSITNLSFNSTNGIIAVGAASGGTPVGSLGITSVGATAMGVYSASWNFGQYIPAASSAWTAISDERFKDELEPIEDGLNKVATLRAVTGVYKHDEDKNRQVFLIAQDVQKVLPEAVDASDPEKLGLGYTAVIPLLVSALHDAKDRIEALEAEVAALKGA